MARFDHFTTREGDPNIHTHSVVMNVAGSPVTSSRYAAKHLTIEPERLFQGNSSSAPPTGQHWPPS
ncbi:relaxase domain-containing protein [Devosia sp.]